MKYNLSQIMTRAWQLFRKLEITFSEALHRAWQTAKAALVNEQRIADAKAAAGIDEQTETWSGWKALGYEVIHGSKALFGCDLIYASKGDGAIYKQRDRMKVNKTMGVIYDAYIADLSGMQDTLHDAWKKISGQIENKLDEGNLKTEDFGTYEETVAHAAFYAGFKAAMDLMG